MDKPKEKAIVYLELKTRKDFDMISGKTIEKGIDIALKAERERVKKVIDEWGIKQKIEGTLGFKELKQKIEKIE